MQSLEALQRALAAEPPASRTSGRIVAISARKGGGVHERLAECELDVARGVIGDRWELASSPKRHSQVTLMSAFVARMIGHAEREGFTSGDNFYVELDLSEDSLPAGTRLELGGAVLEVTEKPHRGCSKFSARFGEDVHRWVNLPELLSRRLRGIHCEVIQSGRVREGELIRVLAKAQLELALSAESGG